MTCPEKKQLMVKYGKTARQFAEIITGLQKEMGVLSKDEYDLRLKSAQAAQGIAEEARLVLEQHISAHKC